MNLGEMFLTLLAIAMTGAFVLALFSIPVAVAVGIWRLVLS